MARYSRPTFWRSTRSSGSPERSDPKTANLDHDQRRWWSRVQGKDVDLVTADSGVAIDDAPAEAAEIRRRLLLGRCAVKLPSRLHTERR